MRRAHARAYRSIDVWPGYVDALTTLLLAITFLLTVYVLAQFFLSQALSGREKALARLSQEIEALNRELSRRAHSEAGSRSRHDPPVGRGSSGERGAHRRRGAPRGEQDGRRGTGESARRGEAHFYRCAVSSRATQPADCRAARSTGADRDGAERFGDEESRQPVGHRRSRQAARCRTRGESRRDGALSLRVLRSTA